VARRNKSAWRLLAFMISPDGLRSHERGPPVRLTREAPCKRGHFILETKGGGGAPIIFLRGNRTSCIASNGRGRIIRSNS
jgi:hypothetical protein